MGDRTRVDIVAAAGAAAHDDENGLARIEIRDRVGARRGGADQGGQDIPNAIISFSRMGFLPFFVLFGACAAGLSCKLNRARQNGSTASPDGRLRMRSAPRKDFARTPIGSRKK
jgi:hypothetical protein